MDLRFKKALVAFQLALDRATDEDLLKVYEEIKEIIKNKKPITSYSAGQKIS